MWNVGALVKIASDSVADVFVHDSEVVLGSFCHNGLPNDRDQTFRFDRFNREIERVKSALRDLSRLVGRLTDHEGFTLIAKPSVHNRG